MAGFASTADLAEKQASFDELGPGLYAYTAEGDPNSGIVVGSDGVTVIDAQATPAMAQQVLGKIATVTDKPRNPHCAVTLSCCPGPGGVRLRSAGDHLLGYHPGSDR